MAGGYRSHHRVRTRGVRAGLRARVLTRDGGVCQIAGPCCVGVATEVDHIIAVCDGGTDEVSNLRAVCSVCHAQKTQEEAQRGRMRYGRRRQPQMHPSVAGGGDPGVWARWGRVSGRFSGGGGAGDAGVVRAP